MWIRKDYGQEPTWPRVILLVLISGGLVFVTELLEAKYGHTHTHGNTEEADG